MQKQCTKILGSQHPLIGGTRILNQTVLAAFTATPFSCFRFKCHQKHSYSRVTAPAGADDAMMGMCCGWLAPNGFPTRIIEFRVSTGPREPDMGININFQVTFINFKSFFFAFISRWVVASILSLGHCH